LVGALVAHHTHALDRKQNRKRLPDFFIPAGFTNFFNCDPIRAPQLLSVMITSGFIIKINSQLYWGDAYGGFGI
jgi:hypothetical protein